MKPIEGEDAALAWIDARIGPSAQQWEQLRRYVALLLNESERQNLIAASTADHVWARHIVDSAQLVPLIGADARGDAPLADLGSGAGLPGIVLAILLDRPVRLIEARALRVRFLEHVVTTLGLGARVAVLHRRLEAVPSAEMGIITARAFAPLDRLLAVAARFAGDSTQWLLPKGRNGANEWEALPPAWRSLFHVEQSITDADSVILVGRGKAVTATPAQPARRQRGKR